MSARLEKLLICIVAIAVIVPVFFATGAIPAKHSSEGWIVTPWDAYIPLVPLAIWPYASWYLAPAPLLAASRRDFRRMACAIVLAFAICTLGYILFPISIQRPIVSPGTLSERAILLLYRLDPPWNIFPSFHAALCAILWRPVVGGTLTRRIMPVWMSMICISCVLTRQHHLLDIPVGMAVGFATLTLTTALFNRLQKPALLPPHEAGLKAELPVAAAQEAEPVN